MPRMPVTFYAETTLVDEMNRAVEAEQAKLKEEGRLREAAEFSRSALIERAVKEHLEKLGAPR